MSDDSNVDVAQADRERFASISRIEGWCLTERGDPLLGAWDDDESMIEIARHRIAAQSESREREAALVEALEKADAAIKEMFRYFDGGETRGSYDGKPERNHLRRAGYIAEQALAAHRDRAK